MDLDDARAILREDFHAVLATPRRDGTPQLSPTLGRRGCDGPGVSSRATAHQTKLRREPRASLVTLTSAGPDRAG